ncbi:unnamed protein product, partial [Ectocarpus fasciculatus]
SGEGTPSGPSPGQSGHGSPRGCVRKPQGCFGGVPRGEGDGGRGDEQETTGGPGVPGGLLRGDRAVAQEVVRGPGVRASAGPGARQAEGPSRGGRARGGERQVR